MGDGLKRAFAAARATQGPKKLRHPCAGMTPAQKRDFEFIAVGQRPLGGKSTINALLAKGLIQEDRPELLGRDRFGPIEIPRWYVPLPIHMDWCEWCAQQPDNELD